MTLEYLRQLSTVSISVLAIVGIVYGGLKMKLTEDMSKNFVDKDHCDVIHNQLVSDVKEIKDDIKFLIRKEIERSLQNEGQKS